MFETTPTVKKTFEKFRELDTPSDLQTSTVLETHGLWAGLPVVVVLETHGLVVMHAIDEIISSFEDEEERDVLDLILEQGRSHARFSENMNEEIFWVYRPMLI